MFPISFNNFCADMICWYRWHVCCLLCGCILKNHFDHQVRTEVVLVLLVVKLCWCFSFSIFFFTFIFTAAAVSD